MMNIDNIKIKKCSKCKLLHVCKYRVQVEVQIRDANKFLNYSMNANAYENCIATFCKFHEEKENE